MYFFFVIVGRELPGRKPVRVRADFVYVN